MFFVPYYGDVFALKCVYLSSLLDLFSPYYFVLRCKDMASQNTNQTDKIDSSIDKNDKDEYTAIKLCFGTQ